jgi:hypothetical protein
MDILGENCCCSYTDFAYYITHLSIEINHLKTKVNHLGIYC